MKNPDIYVATDALMLYEGSTLPSVPRTKDVATQIAAGELLVVLGRSGIVWYYEVVRCFDGYPAYLHSDDKPLIRSVASKDLPQIFSEIVSPNVIWDAEMRENIVDRCTALCEIKEKSPHGIYVWGGIVLPNVDCSGLVQSVYREEAGIVTRRNASQQYIDATSVLRDDVLPGDLVFFRNDSGNIFHVWICKSTDEYYHSSGYDHGHGGMGINRLECDVGSSEDAVRNNYYASRIAGYGRIEKQHLPCSK
jgi:NlpC/P60 family/Bacterial dipeptidyl-peptidase Sh3 domain